MLQATGFIDAGSSGERWALYLRAMKPTPFYRWWITDPETGYRRRTSWRMQRSEALKHDENAEPDLSSVEMRMLPESPAEHELTGAWLRKT